MLGHALEAHCDYLHIRIGKQLEHDMHDRIRQDHEIAAPGMHASAILTYRNASGNQQDIRVSDRHVCVIPAGHRHSARWTSDGHLTVITFKPSFLRELAQANGCHGHDIVPHYAAIDPFIWHMARTVEQQLQLRQTLERSYVESFANVLGHHLLHHYGDVPMPASSNGGLPRYKIRRAIEYIRAHHHEEIGFKDVADQLDMSPFHFSRMFKQSTQESPQQFIMRCRIDSAKKLLIESEKSIADIAFEVGYKSQSYFTTRFALLVGMTPAVFRTAN